MSVIFLCSLACGTARGSLISTRKSNCSNGRLPFVVQSAVVQDRLTVESCGLVLCLQFINLLLRPPITQTSPAPGPVRPLSWRTAVQKQTRIDIYRYWTAVAS